MEDIFNFLNKLDKTSFGVGVNREKVLFISMVNEKENILLKENYNVDLLRIIEFISNVVDFKETFEETYKEIIMALKVFKDYGREDTTLEKFKKHIAIEKEQKYD